MQPSSTIIAATMIFLVTASASAEREKIIVPTPNGSVKTFKFKSDKGDVTFNHDLHVHNMKNEACIPCHRVDKPTSDYVNSRFEERTAHSFCRGCHRQMDKGPTDCHECHRQARKVRSSR